jgi:opacity protein-like surface antigen
MKMLKKICAATLVYGLTVAPAMAEGFYAALDVGQTDAKDTCNTGVDGCNDSSTAIRAAGGYQFTQIWGMEVSYATYGKANLGGTYGDWKTSGVQASGIGTFPVAESFSVLGKLGVARIEHQVNGATSTRTNLAWGLGAQYDFNKRIAFRAQYEQLGTIGDANTTGEAKASLISVGALYRF